MISKIFAGISLRTNAHVTPSFPALERLCLLYRMYTFCRNRSIILIQIKINCSVGIIKIFSFLYLMSNGSISSWISSVSFLKDINLETFLSGIQPRTCRCLSDERTKLFFYRKITEQILIIITLKLVLDF